jgi:hypothetical protein
VRKVLLVWLLALFTAAPLASLFRPVHAQGSLQISDPQVDYLFGNFIAIEANLETPEAVDTIALFLQPEGASSTESIPVAIEENNRLFALYDFAASRSLPAFSTIAFWFAATLENGQTLESEHFDFAYLDNRFEWQGIENAPFRVQWYQGDIVFGQQILDTARTAVEHIQEQISLETPGNVAVYVYASGADLQQALQFTSQTWIAGHADPDLGVMLVSILPGPEQSLEMERQIPHELAHIMIFETIGADGYAQIPLWLNEGLASLAELYPNPDYRQSLERASAGGGLIPLANLCESFPTDASGASLAYAESESFTRYLYEEHGASGLLDLLNHYAAGQGCDNGPQAVLGATLTQLERDWRATTFSESSAAGALQALLPWFVLMAVVVGSPVFLALLKSREKKAEPDE